MSIFMDEQQIDQTVIKNIIRPPRFNYSESDLGPKSRILFGEKLNRTDFEVTNRYNNIVKCSLFDLDVGKQTPLVVYLHGNAGSRMQALPLLRFMIPNGYSLLCFDFSGCGLSSGDYVTLGMKQQSDIETVMTQVMSMKQYTGCVLWGRSMGAVTSILYAGKANNSFIKGLVLDSPFSNFKTLMRDIANNKMNFGSLFLDGVVQEAQKQIKRIVGFDIFSLNVASQASQCNQPALFAYSYNDKLVPASHSESIKNQYSGSKKSVLFTGDHNSSKDDQFFQEVIQFIGTLLKSEKSEASSKGEPGAVPVPSKAPLNPFSNRTQGFERDLLEKSKNDIGVNGNLSSSQTSSNNPLNQLFRNENTSYQIPPPRLNNTTTGIKLNQDKLENASFSKHASQGSTDKNSEEFNVGNLFNRKQTNSISLSSNGTQFNDFNSSQSQYSQGQQQLQQQLQPQPQQIQQQQHQKQQQIPQHQQLPQQQQQFINQQPLQPSNLNRYPFTQPVPNNTSNNTFPSQGHPQTMQPQNFNPGSQYNSTTSNFQYNSYNNVQQPQYLTNNQTQMPVPAPFNPLHPMNNNNNNSQNILNDTNITTKVPQNSNTFGLGRDEKNHDTNLSNNTKVNENQSVQNQDTGLFRFNSNTSYQKGIRLHI